MTEATETLSVKTDETLINRFKEQKSLVEIAQKYEAQYARTLSGICQGYRLSRLSDNFLTQRIAADY